MNLSDVAIVEVPVAQFFKVKDTMSLFTTCFLPFLTNFESAHAHALTLLKTNEDVCMVGASSCPHHINICKNWHHCGVISSLAMDHL